jgi:hypothetical protein
MNFQRANIRFRFGLAFRPLQIGADFGFSVRTELFFSVLPRFQALICAIFRTEPVNWRLFFGFGSLTGSVRDALTIVKDGRCILQTRDKLYSSAAGSGENDGYGRRRNGSYWLIYFVRNEGIHLG